MVCQHKNTQTKEPTLNSPYQNINKKLQGSNSQRTFNKKQGGINYSILKFTHAKSIMVKFHS